MKNKEKLSLGQKAVRLGLVGVGLYMLKNITDKMVEKYDNDVNSK
jgi:hypothetical protein